MKGFIAWSCLDYLEHGVFESDCYWLFDNKDRRYVAYCDLSSEPGSAWTLVMSWDRTNKNLPQFQRKTFLEDAPINHNTPNWNFFRQTLERMKNIRSRSSHWRATCSFNSKQVLDYRDYIRGKFNDFDIMTFLGDGKCQPVEFVNIRWHAAGSGTTAQFGKCWTPTFCISTASPQAVVSSLILEPFQVNTILATMAVPIATFGAPQVMIQQPSGGLVDIWLKLE